MAEEVKVWFAQLNASGDGLAEDDMAVTDVRFVNNDMDEDVAEIVLQGSAFSIILTMNELDAHKLASDLLEVLPPTERNDD